jgi:putative MATE family efflux protein
MMVSVLPKSPKIKLTTSFLLTVLLVAVPISIQNLAQSAVGFVDTAMVSQLGKAHLAAVGLSNQIFFFLIVTTLGLASGAGVLITRYWGAKDLNAIRRTTGLAIMAVLLASVTTATFSFFHAQKILFFLSSKNAEIAILGTPFLRITAFSFPITALTIVMSIQLRCVDKSHYPMYMSLISLPIDIILNYILIYGELGFPRMELMGAGIATLITRIIELITTLFFFASKRNPIWAGCWSHFFTIFKTENHRQSTSIFLKLALPITAMELLWVIGQSFYKLTYATIGIDALAAYTALESVINLFSVVFIGLGNTAAILIGRELGAFGEKSARTLASQFIRLNFAVFLPMGLLMALVSPFAAEFFKLEGQAGVYIVHGMFLSSMLLSFKSLSFLLLTGILRAGGDAQFISIVAAIGLLSVGIPLTYLFAIQWHKGFLWVLFAGYIEEMVRTLLCLWRYKTGQWLKKTGFEPPIL